MCCWLKAKLFCLAVLLILQTTHAHELTAVHYAGINKALKRQGITEGDTVIVGDAELAWSDNQSEAALYDAWVSDRRAKGKVAQGASRWPHPGG